MSPKISDGAPNDFSLGSWNKNKMEVTVSVKSEF